LRLAAQAEPFDQGLVAALVDLLDIVEQAATGRNKLEQTAAGMVILAMALEVFGEVGNAFRQDGNLNFGRTGIVRLDCIFLDQSGFALGRNRRRTYPLY